MKFLKLLLVLVLSITVSACQSEKKSPTKIKVGAIDGPETQLVQTAAKVAKEKYGLDVEIVSFTDYVTPNIALNDGSIDINAFQHQPYLDSTNKNRGFKLVSIGKTFIYPIAAYSKKIKTLDELRDGAKVAIPNDPTNEGRTLLVLERAGYIKLREGAGLTATPVDIEKNPKNLEFIELDAAQLPRSLEDTDISFINNTFASQVGLNASEHGLLVEDGNSPYANIIAAKEDRQKEEALLNFVKSYQSEEVAKKAHELFKGGSIPAWN